MVAFVNRCWHLFPMPDRPANRPPSRQRTQAAILKAAQELFAGQGYERTTVSDVAARAAIDPAMVMRYFGSKEALFARATAFDLGLPDLTKVARARRCDAGRAFPRDLGRSAQQRQPDQLAAGRGLQRGCRRGGPHDLRRPGRADAGAGGPAGRAAGARRADRHPDMGLAVTRYVLKVPPVVALDRAQIVRLLGPTMQRYVAGKL